VSSPAAALNGTTKIIYAISFFTVMNGQIMHEVDWWPEPDDPPPGREPWTERMQPAEPPITR
jgi:hypothetical protein